MLLTIPEACPGSTVWDCLISQSKKLVRLSTPSSARRKMTKGKSEKNSW
jgi:hypothetical protein